MGRISLLVILVGTILLWGCAPGLSPTADVIKTEVINLPLVAVEGGIATTQEAVETLAESSTPVAPTDTPQVVETEMQSPVDEAGGGVVPDDSGEILADVISVQVSGSEGAYQFSVGIRSPDEGCEQYADWWEVVSEDGGLIYRRILLHSHVGEQPFVRSGGPVAISPDTIVWVRAHMNTGGYGGAAFRGSVQAGFVETDLDLDFAADLAEKSPLPNGCAF